jgi:hypothetical protein
MPMRKYRQRIHYTETDKALMWDRGKEMALKIRTAQVNKEPPDVLFGCRSWSI